VWINSLLNIHLLTVDSAAALQGTVVIEVGPERKKYHVHRALLTHQSDYFRRALNGEWKEAKEGLVTLDDVEPSICMPDNSAFQPLLISPTVEIFVDWLYSQKLPGILQDWETLELDGDSQRYSADLRWIKGLAFADRFLARTFQQAVHNGYVDKVIGTPPWYEVVTYAFASLPSVHPMLSLLVDTHCAHWS